MIYGFIYRVLHSSYQGINQLNKILVRQNNIEILFLIKLCEKFEELSIQLHSLENHLASLERVILQKGKGVEGQASRAQSRINEEDIAKYFEKLILPKKLVCRIYRK